MKQTTRLIAGLAIVGFLVTPLLQAFAQAEDADAEKNSSAVGVPVSASSLKPPVAPPVDKQPDKAPNPASNAVLADFIKNGVKAYYLGLRGSLNGWFLVKDNQIQIAYSTLDNHEIIFGAMYDALGNNVSSDQIKTLYDTNKEVYTFLTNYNAQQQQQQMQMGKSSMGMPPMPGTPNNTAAMASMTDQPQQLLPSTTPTPGERLIHALTQAEGSDLGSITAPRIYMVADPNCPHCQATWKMLRGVVLAGKLQVRIVPIDAQGTPDSERAAARFLRAPDPLAAWDKYIADGDKSQLAGAADDAAVIAVRNNHALIDSWHIQMTPFIVYRSKKGEVKIEQGEPTDPAALISDIGL